MGRAARRRPARVRASRARTHTTTCRSSAGSSIPTGRCSRGVQTVCPDGPLEAAVRAGRSSARARARSAGACTRRAPARPSRCAFRRGRVELQLDGGARLLELRNPPARSEAILGAVKTIDLRSDTVTKPSAAMREAMAHAEVGDDVYGEDPSVNRLQALAAARLGKEAALFVPSGTMANQIALRALTEPGDAAIAARDAHMVLYESGAAAALAGVQLVEIGEGGSFGPDALRQAVYPSDDHFARTRAVLVENTHNRAGGRVFPFEQLAARDRGRARARAAHAHGRRASLQRRGRDGDRRRALGRAVRHGELLPVEGTGSTGRLARRRLARPDRARAPLPQAARRGHAAGGHPRGRGHLRAGAEHASASPTTTRTRAGSRPGSPSCPASSCRLPPRRTS